jgi:hypothetical protein
MIAVAVVIPQVAATFMVFAAGNLSLIEQLFAIGALHTS